MTIKLLNWSQAFNTNSEECGGKGWNLARLYHYGFKIPKGGTNWVIQTGSYKLGQVFTL